MAPLYNFSSTGPGKFTFEAIAAIASDTDTLSIAPLTVLKASAPQGGFTITVVDDVADRLLEPKTNKRATNACADLTKRAFITAR